LAVSSTITLDGNQTVGSLTFNNSTGGYTLADGSGGTLTLNNSSSTGGSQLMVLAGTHSITAPVIIAGDSLTISESNSGRLLITGSIGDDNDAESLTLGGDGTGRLLLSGTNTYGGGTCVEAGTLIATNSEALPDGSSLTVGNASLFPSYAPVIAAASASPVPEPATLALLAVTVCAAAVYRSVRLRRKE
jgi:autotransporter-associated beta strand protein